MAKNKIPKNRSLEDMFAGVKEELTFETADRDDEAAISAKALGKPRLRQTKGDLRKQFFTDDLQEKVGPSYWILNWPIIRTVSAIYRCKWLKTAGTSLSRRLRKPENTIHKVVLQ